MATIESGTFAGPAGALEYLLTIPAASLGAPARAAVVSHPNPLGGGTMHTRLVFQTAAALRDLGLPVLRFQFRGVGRSGGAFDRGHGEQDDLLAALAFLRRRYPLPVVAAGFSFGALVTARLLSRQPLPEIERALLIGLPADRVHLPSALLWRGPILMISGGADEFASAATLKAWYAALPPPKKLLLVAGADHFLAGRGDEFTALLQRHLDFERAPAGQETPPVGA